MGWFKGKKEHGWLRKWRFCKIQPLFLFKIHELWRSSFKESCTLKTEFLAASPHRGVQLSSDPAATRQLVRTASLKFSCASHASLSPWCITAAGNGRPTSGWVVSHRRKSGWTGTFSATSFLDFSSPPFSTYCVRESSSVAVLQFLTIVYERKR